MIRYGGLYARHRSIDKKLHLAISKEKQQTFRSFNRWRTSILSSFGYDPLICPHCKQQLVILEIYQNHRRVPLEELYEKAMSRSPWKAFFCMTTSFLCYNPHIKEVPYHEKEYQRATRKNIFQILQKV